MICTRCPGCTPGDETHRLGRARNEAVIGLDTDNEHAPAITCGQRHRIALHDDVADTIHVRVHVYRLARRGIGAGICRPKASQRGSSGSSENVRILTRARIVSVIAMNATS